MDAVTISSLRNRIEVLLENFEPRVIMESLEINDMDDNNRLAVTIRFKLINSPSGETYTLDTFLDRIK